MDECKHVFCKECLEGLKHQEQFECGYRCSECNKFNKSVTPNYKIANSLIEFENEEKCGEICKHVTSKNGDKTVEKCNHCYKNFCHDCMEKHQHFLRFKTEVLISNVC